MKNSGLIWAAIGGVTIAGGTAAYFLLREPPKPTTRPSAPSPAPSKPPEQGAHYRDIYRATVPQLVAAIGRSAWRRIVLPNGWSVEVMQQPATEFIPSGVDLTQGQDIYLPADYATALSAAKQVNASLMTPTVMDAVYRLADSKLKPCILPATADMASLEWARRHSACVTAQHPYGLTANAGKGWVRGLVLRPDQAANHGWYDAASPNGRLWQDRGRQHNRKHVDYSQTVQLMRNAQDAKGTPQDINAVLKGPSWAMLGAEQERSDDAIA